MKIFAVVFAVFFAGISALPQPSEIDALRSAIIQKDARIVAGIIENMLNSIKERLVANGYDPYVVDQRNIYAEATDDIAVSGGISNLRLVGIANIVANRINYGLITGNLDLDLELPSVSVSADDVSGDLHIWSLNPNTFSIAKVSGSAGIRRARITVSCRVNIGLISGISITNLQIRVSLGGIDSDLKVEVIGNDYSAVVNRVVGEIIPQLLWDNSATINDLVLRIALYAIDQIL